MSFYKIIFHNYFCGVLWEQKFQTHKKNVENRKKLLKKLGRYSNQKDIANYTLSCNLREELVAVSERKDICNAIGKNCFSYYSTVSQTYSTLSFFKSNLYFWILVSSYQAASISPTWLTDSQCCFYIWKYEEFFSSSFLG